jgi:RNA polymerase sigma factor (sigma-70 family)
MASGPSAAVANQLRDLVRNGTVGGLTDGQLLDRFVQRHDEAAFAALVERHGPMVLRVCRRRLGDAHDAEDAFQATFLVLARKAQSIRRSEAVAGWLVGVAGRVSAKSRAADRRRVRAEQKAGISADLAIDDKPSEPWTELYQELDRLPEKYRLPLILCYLEGLTYEQAATQLRCPIRTIQSRLTRAKERLRTRLERRGLAPSAAMVGSAFAIDQVPAFIPVSLKEGTATAALRFLSGEGTAAGTSPAAALAGEVLRAMFFGQLNAVAKLALLLGLVAAGGWLARRDEGTPLPRVSAPAREARQRAAPPQKAPAAAKKEESPFRMTGTVRVEATGEPVAGATVRIHLGTNDHGPEYREDISAADGRYVIPLPPGHGWASVVRLPAGFWLPDSTEPFTVWERLPGHRRDFLARRGTVWTFRLTRGPRREPVGSAYVSASGGPGEATVFFQERTDANGVAIVTLPDDDGKLTLHLAPEDPHDDEVDLNLLWSRRFRPGTVKSAELVTGSDPPRLRLVDESGEWATVEGPVMATITGGKLVLVASLPEFDPRSTGTLTGTVVDRDGRPIAGAGVIACWGFLRGRVQVAQGGTGGVRGTESRTYFGPRVRTDSKGVYVIPSLPRRSRTGDPITVSLVIYKEGYAGTNSQGIDFQPGEDGKQTADPVRLDPGVSLRGIVVDPDGRPVEGALIYTLGIRSFNGSPVPTRRSGPGGEFTIPYLFPGEMTAIFHYGRSVTTVSHRVAGPDDRIEVRLKPAP